MVGGGRSSNCKSHYYCVVPLSVLAVLITVMQMISFRLDFQVKREILEKNALYGENTQLICYINWKEKTSIRIENKFNKYSEIERGVRQGDASSPDLFNLYNEMIQRDLEVLSELLSAHMIFNNIRYTDDIVNGRLTRKAERLLDKIKDSEKKRLSINYEKCESIDITKKKQQAQHIRYVLGN